MVCPYRILSIKSDQPVSTPEKNMVNYITEKQVFPECQGEACPFYFRRETTNAKEFCRKADAEIL